jgi:hypothetical protein
MTAPVYCGTCEQMTHPTFPHSCFSAATLRAHKDAERAVIEAAKYEVDWCLKNPHDHTSAYWVFLVDAVAALRAVEGEA